MNELYVCPTTLNHCQFYEAWCVAARDGIVRDRIEDVQKLVTRLSVDMQCDSDTSENIEPDQFCVAYVGALLFTIED